MTTLDHAKNYLDLPPRMQDDDAREFACDLESMYRIYDRLKAEIRAAVEAWDGSPLHFLPDTGMVARMSAPMDARRKSIADPFAGVPDVSSSTEPSKP